MYTAYTAFERIIQHYESDGTTLTTADISSDCTHAEFTLAAERGCCRGTLVMAADETGAFDLDHGDVIKFVPETGADPWYTGCVVGRERDATSSLHTYRLDGLAVRLAGLPVIDGDNEYQFGTGATGDYAQTGRYYPSHATAGIVQWIAYNTVADANVGIVTDGSGFDYTFMTYNTASQIALLRYDQQQDCENVISELARMCYDQQSSHSGYPFPALWGVDADRVLYFYFRPDTKIMRLHVGDANYHPGLPTLYLNGTRVEYQGWEEREGEDFYNVLVLRGNADSDGNTVSDTYTDSDSITKYGRRRIDFQEVPGLASTGPMGFFAQGYFDRYADPQSTHAVKGAIITDKDQLPKPWSGYCALQDYQTNDGDLAGKRTIQSVTVNYDNQPTADITIGEVSPSVFVPESSAMTRYPGNAWKDTQNRIPRVPSAAPEGTSGSTVQWQFVVNEGE